MEKEAEETNKSAVRIFVGGLGEAVSAQDLRTLFSSLGTVQTVQPVRTKGRSFAYLDFLSDPKSLSKLFSKYNGCVWKGGRLKLEKAKEDYLARLKKEWEQEKALNDATQPPASVPEKMPNSPATDISKSDTKHLNIFFPRLRKVKSIPFSGTGKHKYSFKNIEVPPLPVHFCDCEEHCSPFVSKREKLSIEGAAERGGMNDEEISIMNSVMNKLFGKENVSNAKNLGEEKKSFESPDALHSDECEDSATDEDDLIINMETKKSKKALIGNQELERILENQESWFNKKKFAKEESNKSMPRVQNAEKRINSIADKSKKRKSLLKSEMESNGEVSTTPGGKSNLRIFPDEVGSGVQPTELEDDDWGEATRVSWSQKSSWRKLLGDGGNTTFSASLILPKLDCGKNQGRSDDVCAAFSTKNKTQNMERDGNLSKPTNTQLVKELDEAQPTNTQVIEELAKAQLTNKQVIEELAEAQPTNTQVIEELAKAQLTNKQVIEELAEAQPTNTQVIEELAEAQLTNTQVIEELAEAQHTNKHMNQDLAENQHNVAPNKTGRGASWLRKQSWTQLVSENNNSFSISHILPGFTFPEPMAEEPVVEPVSPNDCKNNGVAKDSTNEVVSDGFNPGEIVPEKSQHIGANDIASASVAEEKVETSPREGSTENVEIGETCSFMRSAASLKEWARAKAAMSGSLKRKRGEK